MIRKLVLYSFVFLWGGSCVCAAQEMFSTKREFGPVRFSQEQLLKLVDRLRVFAEQQGSSPAESDDASQTLSLSDEQTTLRISEEISVETLDAAPPVSTSVYYKYRNRTGVISSINIRLWDTSRTVEISGRSRDQVEAAASVASTIISQAETIVGGRTHRAFGGFFLLAGGLILTLFAGRIYLPLQLTRPSLTPSMQLTKPILSLSMQLTGLILALSIWLPWEEWLPGTAVYRDDPSFLVRYAALSSFLGLIGTIVAIVLGVIGISRGTQSPVKTQVNPTDTEGD